MILLFTPFDICLTDDEYRATTGYNYDENGCIIEEPWQSVEVCKGIIIHNYEGDCLFPKTKTLWENIAMELNIP